MTNQQKDLHLFVSVAVIKALSAANTKRTARPVKSRIDSLTLLPNQPKNRRLSVKIADRGNPHRDPVDVAVIKH
ncbi:MAG: hypothetical protein R6V33_03630 [Pelovirga sp.]